VRPSFAQLEGAALEEDDELEGEMKPPDEEFKLAKILADQGKYNAAVKHFKNVLKHFEEEDPKNREEQFWKAVAELHVVAYKLKKSLDDGQLSKEQSKLCLDWLDGLFPAKPRAAGEMFKGSGEIRHVRNAVQVRKAIAEKAVSALVLHNVDRSMSAGAIRQVKKWVEQGHKALVQDDAAEGFGFTVAAMPQVRSPRINRDRKAIDHPILMAVRPDTLSFATGNLGWCATGHISPSAKPLLTMSLPAQGGRRPTTVVLCGTVKLGKGELLFCNGQIDAQSGDGSKLYQNVQAYLRMLPGQESKGPTEE